MERDWGALDIGHRPGIGECDECIGQFLQQQQAEEAQHPARWPFWANSDTPGTRERRSESAKAQAFFVIFMPHFFIPSHKEDRQAVRELGNGGVWDGNDCGFERPCLANEASNGVR